MKLVEKIKSKIFYELYETGIFNKLDDLKYLKFLYKYRTGKKLNINNPQTFNEKMQWLSIYNRKDIYTKMADKYETKKNNRKMFEKKLLLSWERVAI